MEYLTEALVLGTGESGEADKFVDLYTKELGKVSAKAKGARKITSKLSGHLQPLDFTRVRLIEKNGFQIADALAFKKLPATPENLETLAFIKSIAFDLQPDRDLWNFLKAGKNLSRKELLKVLGFDPAFAECGGCGTKNVESFSKDEQNFLCRKCALKSPKNDLVLIVCH